MHRASSIKVAEAAKVIENTQRDLNIALMNELALIFHQIGIDTLEVLEAAGTKWNFLPFRPGLVGGHCIGVDPYYLTHKADKLGYHPQVILAGRRINDGMGKFIAEQTVKQLIQSGSAVKGADVNVLGLTFKENCPDIRNSRVIDVVHELASYGANVHVHDPVADPDEARHEYGIELKPWDALPRARAIVAAVAHRDFKRRPTDDYVTKLDAGRAVRRRQVPGRRRAVPGARRQRLEAVIVEPRGAPDAFVCMLRSAARAAEALAGDRQRRLHRLASARDAAGPRPGRRQPRQLRHRPPQQPRRGARGRSASWRGASTAFIEGDIVDADACRSACEDVDIVLHQAALGSVPRSIEDPLRTHAANATGFLNMLVAARDAGVERFVYAASSSTYGDHPGLPKVEDAIGRPLSPYAVTKYVDELYAQVFARCYGVAAIGLRYFNVFGPRQDPDGAYAAVIPRWVAAMLAGTPIVIYGDGETTRDFCYVDNVVQANLLAATAPRGDRLGRGLQRRRRRPHIAQRSVCGVARPGGRAPSRLAHRGADLRGFSRRRRAPLAGRHLARRSALSATRRHTTLRAGLREALPWYESDPSAATVAHAVRNPGVRGTA